MCAFAARIHAHIKVIWLSNLTSKKCVEHFSMGVSSISIRRGRRKRKYEMKNAIVQLLEKSDCHFVGPFPLCCEPAFYIACKSSRTTNFMCLFICTLAAFTFMPVYPFHFLSLFSPFYFQISICLLYFVQVWAYLCHF